jgi:hypothetical protein
MVKLIFTSAQQPGANREEMRRHVTEVHGPLVVSVRQAIAPMYRYVQHLSLSGKKDTAFGLPIGTEYAVVIEMLLESFEAMVAARQTKEFRQKIVPDEERMGGGGFSSVLAHFVREVEILPGALWPLTLYHFLKRRSGLSREEFQESWYKEQARLVPGDGPREGLRRYVQNHVLAPGSLPMGTADEDFDIIDEYRFEDLEGMAAFGTDRRRAERIASGHAALTDQTRSFAVLTQGITFIERPGAASNRQRNTRGRHGRRTTNTPS